VSAPDSEQALLERAREIAGRTLADIAARYGQPVPPNLQRAKGWTGELIERALGATAASRPVPDFTHLGVELKTIPVRHDGRPRESTYVCTVPLANHDALTWERSPVRRKLQRVLWMPVEAEPGVPLERRRIGSGLLWSPAPEEDAVLRADWEELMEMVCLGQLHLISARHGTYLQIRPKAANARARRWGTGATGDRELTLPRGFYLRATFTGAVLRHHYALGD
jgi:DNA mismatch repair protein MutH